MSTLTETEIAAEKAARPSPSLVPPRAILAAARAITAGVRKHGAPTYRIAGHVQADPVAHLDSMWRHLLAIGPSLDAVDEGTGCRHLDCAIAQLSIVIDLVEDPP